MTKASSLPRRLPPKQTRVYNSKRPVNKKLSIQHCLISIMFIIAIKRSIASLSARTHWGTRARSRLPGCCTRSRSRRAAEPCTGPPARGRRCSDSEIEAFSWLLVPHSKAKKRQRTVCRLRVAYVASGEEEREMSRYMTGRTIPLFFLSPSLPNALASLHQFNHISDISRHHL